MAEFSGTNEDLAKVTADVLGSLRKGEEKMSGAGASGQHTALRGRQLNVIDVGCGPGLYAREIAKHGILSAIGIDPDPMLPDTPNWGPYGQAAFTRTDLQSWHGGNFDLALCLEVAEHISVMDIREFIRKLCTLAPIVVFSAAAPGQSGDGHMNCREKSHWLALFEQFGFKLDQPKTTQLCQFMVGGPHMGWFTQNVMVLTSYGYRNFAQIEREEAPQAERLASFVAEQLPGWLHP